MEKAKLSGGELKLMVLLWQHEGSTAKELSLLAAEKIGWNKNTTYTVIRKLVAKGAVSRREPGFVCHSLICREDAGREQIKSVLRAFYGGSARAMLASLMADGSLSHSEADELHRMIDEYRRRE